MGSQRNDARLQHGGGPFVRREDKSDYIEHFYDLNPEFQPDGEPTVIKAERMIRDAFETGRPQFEWMCQTISGEPLPVETTLVRVPWKGEVRLAAYSRDLRQEKEREHLILERCHRFLRFRTSE